MTTHEIEKAWLISIPKRLLDANAFTTLDPSLIAEISFEDGYAAGLRAAVRRSNDEDGGARNGVEGVEVQAGTPGIA